MDRVLSRLGLPGWFRNAYFEYHAHVRLRFKLASGLGEPWTRDGSVPQGCPLSMMFIVDLYLPWCRYLAAQEGVQPQLYADNLKCVSRDPDLLLKAARFTTGYVRLVGQEPVPSKCVFEVLSERFERIWRIGICPRRVIVVCQINSALAARVPIVIFSFCSYLCCPSGFLMVGFGWSGLCIFLLLCMGLRLHCLLLTVFVSFGPLPFGLYGLVVSLWLVLVQF